MRSCCSTPRTAVAGARSATSAQAPCRSTKRSSASATIHISWTCARPMVEPLQRIDAKQECRSLETTVRKDSAENTAIPSSASKAAIRLATAIRRLAVILELLAPKAITQTTSSIVQVVSQYGDRTGAHPVRVKLDAATKRSCLIVE